MSENSAVTAREGALIAALAANAKKASDIVVQQVGALIDVTDYFVTLTARNARQADAIIDEIEERERERGLKVVHREMTPHGSWSLLDYGAFIIHVFQPEARDHYRLETLWEAAPLLDVRELPEFEDLEYGERIAAFIDKAPTENAEA